MAEINRQVWYQGSYIQLVAVPQQKSLDGKTMAKRMK
jgi:hypothetical protein